MEPLTEHIGRGVVLRRNDVDTDQIIPAEFCKRLTKSGYADALFAHWRTEPEFVLNRPGAAGASVLIAQHNFGTGSSREHAVWALRDWGFVAVVASSFGDIFHRNALKNGLLAVVLDKEVVQELAADVEADPDCPITVDIRQRQVRANRQCWDFLIDERARWLLLNGYDDIAVTLTRADAITAYEAGRESWLPSVRPGDFSGVPA